MPEEQNKGGRPPGVKRPHKEYTYLNDEEAKLLQALIAKRGSGVAAILREGLLELARKEKLTK